MSARENLPLNGTPRGAGVYPDRLEPVARPGDVIVTRPRGDVYAVEAVTAQPGIITFDSEDGNTLNVAANSTSNAQEVTALEMDEGWVGQLRLLSPSQLPDGVRVQVNWGGRQAQYATANNELGVLTPNVGVEEADDDGGTATVDDITTSPTEFYIDGPTNSELFLTFVNTTGSQVTIQDLVFSGFQMAVRELNGVPSNVAPVALPTRALG